MALPVLCFAFSAALYFDHTNDDAFITYRYSQALATGFGPHFNPGEPVEGYTNFLWMLLLAGVHAVLGADALPSASKWIGLLAMAGAVASTPMLGRRALGGEAPETARVLGALAAILVAVFPGVALNATSGLETGLFTLLIVAALVTANENTEAAPVWCSLSGSCWAAALLTRPEAAAIFGVWWVVHYGLGIRGRAAFADIAPPVAAFIALSLFRFFVYDGALLPNTWYAKSGGYLGIAPVVYVVNGALAAFLGPLGFAAAAAGYGLGAARGESRASLETLAPIAAVGIAGGALPFVTGSDWMPGWRFAVPYLPALAVAVIGGWWRLAQRLLAERAALGLIAAVVVVAGFAHQPERTELADRIATRARGYETGHGELAAWLQRALPRPGGTVALMDIGIVGYRNPALRVLDISGLTDRTIARSPGPFLGKDYDPAYVLDQRPGVIVLSFTAPGDSKTPLRAGAALEPWTRSEERLWLAAAFQRDYVQVVRRGPDETGGWLDRLSRTLGASRVFLHHYPGQYYLLAAFERNEREAGLR